MSKEKSRGLVIRQPWIDLILAGDKIWEIRAMPVNIRGKVRLIQSGSGLVVGEVEIVGCEGPFTLEALKKFRSKHAVSNERLDEWGGYAKNYAWVLSRPVRYKKPQKYDHPPGAVIWVAAKHLP